MTSRREQVSFGVRLELTVSITEKTPALSNKVKTTRSVNHITRAQSQKKTPALPIKVETTSSINHSKKHQLCQSAAKTPADKKYPARPVLEPGTSTAKTMSSVNPHQNAYSFSVSRPMCFLRQNNLEDQIKIRQYSPGLLDQASVSVKLASSNFTHQWVVYREWW